MVEKRITHGLLRLTQISPDNNKRKNYILKKLIVIFFVYSVYLFSQSTYEPIYHQGIYYFLDEQNIKGNIDLFDAIRPITRLTIAEKLMELTNKTPLLTNIEKELLDFYKKEYAFEIKFIEGDTTKVNEFIKFGTVDRFKLYKYYDKNFAFDVDPLFGLSYDFVKKNYHQFSGIQFRGRISDFVGFYFDYRDNFERGDNLDFRKSFSPETGVIISKSRTNSFEYSETRGGLTLGWQWGDFTMAKDFINIGSSYQSQVILSSKAPSFPFIRLDIQPVKWFRYNFIHAWLNSGLLDSNSIRYTGVTSTLLNRSLSYSRRQKFYVSHSLSLMPFENLWFTFGESIIYSDQLEYIYFLPVFYRLADHYNSMSGGDTGDNAQIFFNTSYRWTEIKSKFYLSLFIDELSIESIFSRGNNAQVYAFSLGGVFTNPLWNDNYITIEYNAIKPYVGMNADPLHTYESSGYLLGHWIGSNSVQIYLEMEQYLSREFILKAYINYVIKGNKENISDYYNRITSTYPLLYGDKSIFSEIGGQISFNPFHDFYLELELKYIDKANGRFSSEYEIDEGFQLKSILRYGI